ncbi:MAG: hypothetical protein Q4D94_14495, partial [Bacillota bacterium]|nr:hypothetical protein [Bacillota bacterium]
MKKFLSLLVVSAMVVSLCACGNSQAPADVTEENTEAAADVDAAENADTEADAEAETAAAGVMP